MRAEELRAEELRAEELRAEELRGALARGLRELGGAELAERDEADAAPPLGPAQPRRLPEVVLLAPDRRHHLGPRVRRVAGEVALAALRRLEVGGEDEERARRLRLLALRRLERRDPVAARADQFAEAVKRRLVVDAEHVVDDDDGGAVAQQRLRDALAPELDGALGRRRRELVLVHAALRRERAPRAEAAHVVRVRRRAVVARCSLSLVDERPRRRRRASSSSLR